MAGTHSWAQSAAPYKPGIAAQDYNSSIWKVAIISSRSDSPQLHRELEVSLEYTRSYLRQTKLTGLVVLGCFKSQGPQEKRSQQVEVASSPLMGVRFQRFLLLGFWAYHTYIHIDPCCQLFCVPGHLRSWEVCGPSQNCILLLWVAFSLLLFEGFICLVFETGSHALDWPAHCVAQAGLKLIAILLSHNPEYYSYRCEPP